MSDWLERELGRELAPVAAPEALGTRLGFAPAKRWEVPRLALAVAAAVVLVIGGSYAASRTEALDLRWAAGLRLCRNCRERGQAGCRQPFHGRRRDGLLWKARSARTGAPGGWLLRLARWQRVPHSLHAVLGGQLLVLADLPARRIRKDPNRSLRGGRRPPPRPDSRRPRLSLALHLGGHEGTLLLQRYNRLLSDGLARRAGDRQHPGQTAPAEDRPYAGAVERAVEHHVRRAHREHLGVERVSEPVAGGEGRRLLSSGFRLYRSEDARSAK